ncbi:MAG: GNAT family N-acetyltransferase [Acidimicrobiaceae bacterium]|nr:GNAT family N-acetyltransferase [Acidimicrobiaceae bacterium]
MPRKQSTGSRRARAAARDGEKFTTALRRLTPASWVRTDEDPDSLKLEFSGKVFQWRGPAPYYFVALPEQASLELKAVSSGISYYRGVIRIRARIGDTEWTTSLWPKDGRYLLPLRDSVRKPKELTDGDAATVHITAAVPAGEHGRDQVPSRPSSRQGRDRSGQAGADVVAARRRPQVTDDQLRIVPANEATWDEVQAIFGTRGEPSRCWCQRYKMRPKEAWASVGADGLASRLREQTGCGHPEATVTSGLIAYVDDEPAGWCAVDPRPANPRLLSHCRAPWAGRTEAKADDSVWAVTCFVTRVGFRRRGISRALTRAAVEFARQRGARALEGYPHLDEFGHVGITSVFAAAGFVEVSRPTPKRVVMRIDFHQGELK